MSTETEQLFLRPLPDFPPTVWGCTFASLPSTHSEFEPQNQEVEVLKEKVKDMLIESTTNLIENIELINLLCRLGLSYHFDSEIDKQLNHIFNKFQNLHEENNHYDLNTTALIFRILRQYGYKISCDVFKKFKDINGEFKKSITSDVKGLLSLYEATFVCIHGEDVLDEAREFAKNHLEILVEKSNPNLTKHIKNALFCPVHHGVERIQALQYILFYEQGEFRNETLLKFAKLDYNRLQLLYRSELALLSRWWKDLKLLEKLPYARDRIVEVYLWIFGSQFEPHYSSARVIGSKYAKMVSVVDDTFDSYGTTDELKTFTAAFERCSVDAIHQIPSYMKVIYETLLNLFEETEDDEDEGIRYRTSYAKEMFKAIVRCYCIEAEWIHSDEYVPSFDEYVENGLITSTFGALSAATMIGMAELGIKEYQWIQSNPKIIKAAQFIGRLMNDITPHEVEKKKGDCPVGVKSYMKQYDVTKEEAIGRIKKMCEDAWKDINEECMKPKAVPRILLKHFVNHARVTYFIYKFVDCYTHSSNIKDVIESLFISQLPLQ